jgi:hypothetical protein
MDLNELFYRHQISVVRAAEAASPEARHAHRGLVSGYAARIATMQVDAGAPATTMVIA